MDFKKKKKKILNVFSDTSLCVQHFYDVGALNRKKTSAEDTTLYLFAFFVNKICLSSWLMPGQHWDRSSSHRISDGRRNKEPQITERQRKNKLFQR